MHYPTAVTCYAESMSQFGRGAHFYLNLFVGIRHFLTFSDIFTSISSASALHSTMEPIQKHNYSENASQDSESIGIVAVYTILKLPTPLKDPPTKGLGLFLAGFHRYNS